SSAESGALALQSVFELLIPRVASAACRPLQALLTQASRSAQGGRPRGGAGRDPCPQCQGRVARHIFLCVPTRVVTRASLPHSCATGTIMAYTASNRPLQRSLLFSIVHI